MWVENQLHTEQEKKPKRIAMSLMVRGGVGSTHMSLKGFSDVIIKLCYCE